MMQCLNEESFQQMVSLLDTLNFIIGMIILAIKMTVKKESARVPQSQYTLSYRSSTYKAKFKTPYFSFNTDKNPCIM